MVQQVNNAFKDKIKNKVIKRLRNSIDSLVAENVKLKK